MSPAAQTFCSGLLILIVFGWYVATELPRRKRLIGSVLTLMVLALCMQAAFPLKTKVNLGLDLQGGTSFLLRVVKVEGQKVDPQVLEQAVEVIRKRVDKFGVSEPIITPQGNDRILVQIPGMDAAKIEDARQQLQKVAKLELRLVHPQSDQLVPQIEAGQAPVPPGYRVEIEKDERNGKEIEQKLLVRSKPDIEGSYVKSGYPFFDNQGWGVGLQFTAEGADLFGKLTAAHVNQRFAIVLDGVIQSAPVIREAIYGGTASITGNFTEQQARNLASVLENPLAVPVQIAEERSASSTLGAEAIRSGVLAGAGGLAFVLIFVMFYYRVAGVIAIIGLLINLVMLFGIMAMFNFVLTLPGIAGIILTIGLAVDSSVLIYERLREELAAGKPLKTAVAGAYSKAFSVIFDANITSLIMAIILFWLAAGPVRGFAVTLTVGIIASVFTAMIVGRNLFEWSMALGLKRVKMLHLIPTGKNFNFLGKRRLWISISVIVTAIAMGGFAIRGEKNFGIDFKGGDLLMLEATKTKVTVPQVREQLKALGLDDVSSVWSESEKSKGAEGSEFIAIRSPLDTAEKIEAHLDKTMPDAGFQEHRRDRVGKVVGGELARSSLLALGVGIIGILAYVSARFEFSFAIGAIVALLHDVIVTIGLFALAGRELSLVMVGAILTIAGYSINDTIVVFDRIREGLHSGRKGSMEEIMNASINETLSRTLLTSGATFFSVAALFFFGGAVLQDFAFAILIGIVVGTYSSIFIAPSVVLWWFNRGNRNLAAEVRKNSESTVQA